MTTATIVGVATNRRDFSTGHGDFAAFNVKLEDGRVGEVVTKAETFDKRHAEFTALVGKPTELEITEQGTFPDGSPKPLKVKLPAPAGGHGGGGAPAWRNTKEGAEFEAARWLARDQFQAERSDRRTALMQAVAYAAGNLPSEWVDVRTVEGAAWVRGAADAPTVESIADSYYAWLRATASGEGSPAATAETSQPPPPNTARSPVDVMGKSPIGERDGTPAGGEPTAAPADAGTPTGVSSAEPHCTDKIHLGPWTTTKPGGGELREGFRRCETCDAILTERKVAEMAGAA